MEVKRGDVVVVAQAEFGRPRPAVIVQADELGIATTTVLACPITSAVTDNLPVRPLLETGERSGLRLPSQVMTDKMFAVRRDRVRQVIGSLDDAGIGELNRALLVVLGLARP
jgi:mRNA interferase MazF